MKGTKKSTPGIQVTIQAARKPPKDIASVIGKTVIALACIGAVVIIATTFITLNSDAFKFTYEHSSGTSSTRDIPKNGSGLTGLVVSCDREGIAQIKYEGYTCEDVRILDEDLIEWLNATDRRLDSVEIRFATNGKGEISELGMLSADFFVIAAEEARYTAVRDGQAISFTSSTPLEAGRCYSGYFTYPDMRLYWGEEQRPLAVTYMDPECDDRKAETQPDYYTGEELTVYQISVRGKWYYCSRDIYDSIQVGDLLNGYELASNQELAFITGNPQ